MPTHPNAYSKFNFKLCVQYFIKVLTEKLNVFLQ